MPEEDRIPRIIHYCWFGGNPLPRAYKRYLRGWKRLHPGWEIRRWDETNFDVTQNRFCREAFEAKKWAFVSDYARLKVLYDFGGIYMDTDVECLKPLDGFRHHRAFSGFEQPHSIPTGTMGAEKGNPWIAALLSDYDGKAFVLENGALDTTTNVWLITEKTEALHGKLPENVFVDYGDVVFYPTSYFCPIQLGKDFTCFSAETTCIHHFGGSWLDEGSRFWLKYHKKFYYKPLMYLFEWRNMLRDWVQTYGFFGMLKHIGGKAFRRVFRK
ncbi:MAG: glycosyl transferase [Oscillospiraceae bacterium]|jgi:mannosyltransferase OCH1-like enzyme|nr:glycosyl transferase [Oscillospiraceae bacterium]